MTSFVRSVLLLALASKAVSGLALSPRQQTQEAQYVSASFPAYGPESDITGTLLFTNENQTGPGVQITSEGPSALHNFPAHLGPFLYHSKLLYPPAISWCF